MFLWDLRSKLGMAYGGHAGSIQGIAFSPDGHSLASASLDQTVQVRGPLPSSVTPSAVFARLCGVVRRNLSSTEWNEFLPGQPYEKTCPAWP